MAIKASFSLYIYNPVQFVTRLRCSWTFLSATVLPLQVGLLFLKHIGLTHSTNINGMSSMYQLYTFLDRLEYENSKSKLVFFLTITKFMFLRMVCTMSGVHCVVAILMLPFC